MGGLALTCISLAVVLPLAFGIDVTGLPYIFGGLELLLLAGISRSRRFQSAINAKYGRELETYYTLKTITDFYNGLSALSQRRFESFRKSIHAAKQSFAKLKEDFPDLVRNYISRLDNLQLSYVRLLSLHERSSSKPNPQNMDELKQKIETLRTEIEHASSSLKKVKEQRLKLLESRLNSGKSAVENRALIEEQLEAMEEMIRYLNEHPSHLSTNGDDAEVIESLIQDTQELHRTLGEVDDIMHADDPRPQYDEYLRNGDIPVRDIPID